MPFVFTGKRFLVSGASRDMGRALALALAKAGGEVYTLGRNREQIESLVKECENIHPVIADLSDWESTREELKKLPSLHGVVNMADYNAPVTTALEVGKEALHSSFDVSVMAAISVIQITASKMIEDGISGSIVNVSTMAAIKAVKGFVSLNIAKAGLDMVTKQFALELGLHKIRVNSVNPTGVWTGPTKDLVKRSPDIETTLAAITPLGRLCEVQDVIDPIMYLMSEHSTMVTGTTHIIDGGILCNIPVKWVTSASNNISTTLCTSMTIWLAYSYVLVYAVISELGCTFYLICNCIDMQTAHPE